MHYAVESLVGVDEVLVTIDAKAVVISAMRPALRLLPRILGGK
jgi:hypothetical protein